jgi:hypothetical protein
MVDRMTFVLCDAILQAANAKLLKSCATVFEFGFIPARALGDPMPFSRRLAQLRARLNRFA